MTVLKLLAELRTPPADYLMLVISCLGTPFAAAGILSWTYLNVNKRQGYLISFAFYLSSLVAQSIKICVRLPRPWVLDPSFHAVKSAISSATGYSFPSVHSQNTASLYTSVLLTRKEKWIRISAVLMLVLVPFSRMWLGCHTPLDVTVGFLVGAVITLVFFAWMKADGSFQIPRGYFLPGLLLLVSIASLILAEVLTKNKTVPFLLAKDAFGTAGTAIGFTCGYLLERKYLLFKNDGSLRDKLLRFFVAIAGTLLFTGIGHLLVPTSALAVTLRYGLILFWITGMTPLLSIKLGIMQIETGANA